MRPLLGMQYPKNRKGEKKKEKNMQWEGHKPAFSATALQNPNVVHLQQSSQQAPLSSDC